MKRFWIFIFVSMFWLSLKAQDTTVYNTGSTLDTALISLSVDMNASVEVPFSVTSDFIKNFARMLFWKSYDVDFKVGVTDKELAAKLNKTFGYSLAHGKLFNFMYLGRGVNAKLNMIYVTRDATVDLRSIAQRYRNTNTVIVSESRSGLYLGADIIIVKTKTADNGYYTYKYNAASLKRKGIVLSPDFRGLAEQ